MLKFLDINIRQFNDGEEVETDTEPEDFSKYISESGELDVETLVNDYGKDEEPEEPELEDETPEPEDKSEESSQVQHSENDNNNNNDNDNDNNNNEKRTADQAFAEMRRKLEQSEPLAQWVHDLAAQQGFKNPQELIDAYEQQRLAKEAEQKGVPVDVYQRLHHLEQENKRKTEEMKAQQFNQEVENTKQKYNLTNEQINDVFKYMGQNGYNAGDLPFEDIYVLANRETLIREAEERGRQSYLEEKKKQQQQATPNIGTSKHDQKPSDELDYSKEAIFKTLKEYDIDIN